MLPLPKGGNTSVKALKMKLQKILCLVPVVLAMNLLSFVVAQTPEKPFYLHDGDTVVFYGDSITVMLSP